MEKYDVIIIGAGPAGLTAGIYSARYKMKTLIIGKLIGGMAGEAYHVCNFPSYNEISGRFLVNKIVEQVKKLNVDIKQEEVIDIVNSEVFQVVTNKEKYLAKKIIIATGTEKRKLGLEREKELTGRGITYCATCDAPFYKNKNVAVIGGSNSALTTALLLSKIAKNVWIIYKNEKFYRAEPAWIEEIEKNKKIKKIFNAEVIKLYGKEHLNEIEIREKNSSKRMKIDGMFIEIGSVPNSQIAKKLELKTDGEYISVDKKQKTSMEGIFAAGDVTNNSLKQVVTACAEGAIAADSAYRELIIDKNNDE